MAVCPHCGAESEGAVCPNCGALVTQGMEREHPTRQILARARILLSEQPAYWLMAAAGMLVNNVLSMAFLRAWGVHLVSRTGTTGLPALPHLPMPPAATALFLATLLVGGLVLGGMFAGAARITEDGERLGPGRFWALGAANLPRTVGLYVAGWLLAIVPPLLVGGILVQVHAVPLAVFVATLWLVGLLVLGLPTALLWLGASYAGPGVLRGMGDALDRIVRGGSFGAAWAILGVYLAAVLVLDLAGITVTGLLVVEGARGAVPVLDAVLAAVLAVPMAWGVLAAMVLYRRPTERRA